MTQAEMVLEMLKEGSLSSLEAFKELGVTRLAARIDDLRKMGHSIRTETEMVVNRFGKSVFYGRYYLM